MNNSKKRKVVRLTIEIEPEIKRKFLEAVRADGYTMHGVFVKWIKKYLKVSG